ncbi:TPA: protein-L-isoaspartate(D-aspartate) O-methyltransferase [Candidatus Woesearchaeota archaeon]|nr:protein-L-isoaspartate(D-aspartate) O-methyltransferase [Candidatus Woesearchaeota archaeon]HII64881.1 protein-L-isoaspartate(D-aspartate) O-methyltransferase [Candidatus Woesearchaeota archaeon]HIJ19111.1 protein-L-isoaspartate(D-aspartate) O-methyltransferase [Candidatus Woesearchaeota archaeon]
MNTQKSMLTKFWTERFLFTPAELDAFTSVNREDFVLEVTRGSAYDDMPLPILRGKTISQPTTVMLMTHALELEEGDKVFEVGAGSGYQSAIIAKIVGPKGKVVTTEVIPELVQFAKANLKKAGISNAQVHEADGSRGWEKDAPYDKIVITAACREFPKPLIGQLKPEGIIVGPVGDAREQEMVKGVKRKDGTLAYEFLGQFLFSPMVGKWGFED